MVSDGEGFALKEHLGAEEAVLKQILHTSQSFHRLSWGPERISKEERNGPCPSVPRVCMQRKSV